MGRAVRLTLVGLALLLAPSPVAAIVVLHGPIDDGGAAFVVFHAPRGVIVELAPRGAWIEVADPAGTPKRTEQRRWEAGELASGPWRGHPDATILRTNATEALRLLDGAPPHHGIELRLGPGPADPAPEPPAAAAPAAGHAAPTGWGAPAPAVEPSTTPRTTAVVGEPGRAFLLVAPALAVLAGLLAPRRPTKRL